MCAMEHALARMDVCKDEECVAVRCSVLQCIAVRCMPVTCAYMSPGTCSITHAERVLLRMHACQDEEYESMNRIACL